MADSEIKLKCLEIAAMARAKTGLYEPGEAMSDARRFFGWVTEEASKPGMSFKDGLKESPEAKPKK